MFLSAAVWHRLLRALLIAFGGLFLAAFMAVALLRMNYPYALEWMEGGSLAMAHRVADGLPLYPRPTLEWTPFLYAPLYYWLGAGLAQVLGEGFAPLRLISLLATLGTFGLIFDLVHRRTEGLLWGMTGAALYAACFEIGGGWFDIGRVDSLYVFWLLLAVVLLDRMPTVRGHVLAGVVMIAAFLTKQSALVALAPLVPWALITRRGRLRWLLPAVSLGGVALVTVVLARTSSGFLYYLFELPTHHAIATALLHEFWRFDLLAPLPMAMLALIALLLPSPLERSERVWWLVLAVSFVGSAWLSRLHTGGWNNVLLPAYALLAVLTAATAGRWHAQAGPLTRLLVLAACLLQFSLLVYDPRDHLPSEATRAANDALVERLASVEGPVWVPFHPELAAMAGKGMPAHAMALEDVIRAGEGKGPRMIENHIAANYAKGVWDLVVLDGPGDEAELAAHYRLAGPAYPDPDVGWPVTGARTRCEWIYERKPLK